MKKLTTEYIDPDLIDLDLRNNEEILDLLLDNQQQAVHAVKRAVPALDAAVELSAARLQQSQTGRIVMVGAGASGRLAVQDGAELWPTFGWPQERLICCIAGGQNALMQSVEGVEDNADDAAKQVEHHQIGTSDVVIAVAASGRSAWTCAWLEQSQQSGALGVGVASNPDTLLLEIAQCPVLLETSAEVLAGSTRMAAGTAQKIALNLFSTTLMIRLNRTYGNLMVDMAASNRKLNDRRLRLLKAVLPALSNDDAERALDLAGGWVKLAALIASGDSVEQAEQRLQAYDGSLRAALESLQASPR
ncbi:MAG: N-acetylmuramic acid 6-phosphate etherase [Granulosicoccus sp.]|nr:N-acetylmuramic acid 6-phosphate etherase [Granulosicoccus sp.]